MIVAFMLYGPQSHDLANVMIASVRNAMPNAEIVQLSDMRTGMVKAADRVQRIDGRHYPYLLAKHMAMLPQPYVRIDYDMLIQHDLEPAFDGHDLMLNQHGDPKVLHTFFGIKHPIAGAVWGARKNGKEFAEAFYKHHVAYGTDDWLSVVPSVNAVAKDFDVRILPGELYNYVPSDRNDRPDVPVLHFKGTKKHWMLPEHMKKSVTFDEKRVLESVLKYRDRDMELAIHR